jgi:hypothetical protein
MQPIIDLADDIEKGMDYQRKKRLCTFAEKALADVGLAFDEGLSIIDWISEGKLIKGDQLMRVKVFAVTGGSEGYYVHVDVRIIRYTGKARHAEYMDMPLFLGKSYDGIGKACARAAILTEFFGA